MGRVWVVLAWLGVFWEWGCICEVGFGEMVEREGWYSENINRSVLLFAIFFCLYCPSTMLTSATTQCLQFLQICFALYVAIWNKTPIFYSIHPRDFLLSWIIRGLAISAAWKKEKLRAERWKDSEIACNWIINK